MSEVRVGVVVKCSTCGQTKNPVGRSAPLGSYFCDHECPGYRQEPRPGSLWPGERSDVFGYPVGTDGTEPVGLESTPEEYVALPGALRRHRSAHRHCPDHGERMKP